MKPIDGATLRALDAFKARLAQCYREHLKAVYLFGSRARGDHRPDSDLDVAIFLDNVSDPIGEQLDLIDDGISHPACDGDQHTTLGVRSREPRNP